MAAPRLALCRHSVDTPAPIRPGRDLSFGIFLREYLLGGIIIVVLRDTASYVGQSYRNFGTLGALLQDMSNLQSFKEDIKMGSSLFILYF